MKHFDTLVASLICVVLACGIALPDASAFAAESTHKTSLSNTETTTKASASHKITLKEEDASSPSTTTPPKCADTTLTGLDTEKALYASSGASDTIKISPANGRVLYLQHKTSKGTWESVQEYTTDNKQAASIKLEFPTKYLHKSKYSLWRVFIPATETATEYTSEEILLYDRNRTVLPLKCRRAVLMNATTGRVLYDKNMNQRCTQASITKVMTAIVALENCSLNKKITISRKAVRTPWTYIPITRGDKVRMKDLLYSAMLASSNGSATALAEGTAGSTSKFYKLMNKKAKELGMSNSYYVTPHGLPNPTQKTTAYDQALLMSYAAKNPTFMKVVGTKKYSFKTLKKKKRCTVRTTNRLLGSVTGMKGGKTGYTDAAGCCFASIFSYKGQTYSIVVLGCSQTDYRWSDTKKLISYIKSYGW